MSANNKQIGGHHYKEFKYQPWDVVVDWGLGYFDGQALNYISRWRSKNGIEDLQKAIHFLEKLIELQVPVERESPSSDNLSPWPGIKASSESSYPMGGSNPTYKKSHPSGYSHNTPMDWVSLTAALQEWHGKE